MFLVISRYKSLSVVESIIELTLISSNFSLNFDSKLSIFNSKFLEICSIAFSKFSEDFSFFALLLTTCSILLNTSFLSSNNSWSSWFCKTIRFSRSWSFLLLSAILLSSNSSKVFWYSSSILCKRSVIYSLSLLLFSIKPETKLWLFSETEFISAFKLLSNSSNLLFIFLDISSI